MLQVGGLDFTKAEGRRGLVDLDRDELAAIVGEARFFAHPFRGGRDAAPQNDGGFADAEFFLEDVCPAFPRRDFNVPKDFVAGGGERLGDLFGAGMVFARIG